MQKLRRTTSLVNNLDKPVIFLYLILVLMGWLNIYAAVYNEDHNSIFDFSMQYGKQMIWIIAALILASSIMLIESKFFPMFSWPIYGTVIFLLVAVLLFGREVNGARSWFEIGPIRVQPAEFAKLAACLAMAKMLSKHNINLLKFKTLFKLGVVLLIPSVLILLQNDTGSALVYASFLLVLYRQGMSGTFLLIGVFCALLFVFALIFDPVYITIGLLTIAVLAYFFDRRDFISTGIALGIGGTIFTTLYFAVPLFIPEPSTILIVIVSILLSCVPFIFYAYRRKVASIYFILLFSIGSILFISSVGYMFNNVLEKHQRTRINVLLGLESDPHGAEYNVNQSKIAIGSGGFSGKGFLQGTQTKFDFVPEQSTDFIFCTVGEEWGFLGTFTVITLFITLLLRIIYLAERQRSLYSKLLGYCVASILFFHLAVNVGMTIGLAPVIGIPLPFFSYGGSSLWSFTILLFIFIRLDADRESLIQ